VSCFSCRVVSCRVVSCATLTAALTFTFSA
jgi:hypothetical protein